MPPLRRLRRRYGSISSQHHAAITAARVYHVAVKNFEIARLFYEMAALLEVKNESVFRVRAYQRAAQTLETLTEDVADAGRPRSAHRAARDRPGPRVPDRRVPEDGPAGPARGPPGRPAAGVRDLAGDPRARTQDGQAPVGPARRGLGGSAGAGVPLRGDFDGARRPRQDVREHPQRASPPGAAGRTRTLWAQPLQRSRTRSSRRYAPTAASSAARWPARCAGAGRR